MSGYSADVIGKDAGFFRRSNTGFLQKPFSSQALLQTVRHCLDEEPPAPRDVPLQSKRERRFWWWGRAGRTEWGSSCGNRLTGK